MGEGDERLPAGPRGAAGERGAQGKQGERGERGLSSRTARAIVVLFVINALGIGGNLLWTAHEVNANAGDQRQQQAFARAQGAALERKLCATLDPLAGLAKLRPPAGNPSDNPSRAYEQELAARLAPLAQLGPDLGC